MSNDSQKFIDWLNEQMKKNNWTVRETGRRAGISHTPISYALGGSAPSFDTCMALAKVFNFPPIQVLQMAGLLPASAAYDNLTEDELELLYRYRNASPERKADLQRFADIFSNENNQPSSTIITSAGRLNPKSQPR